ncbi:MAG: translocation/assembly module TamB domain-containing protein [Rikenellaceae bacterium]
MLSVPRVQTFAAGKITDIVERKTGVVLSVGHVNMGIFGKISLHDISIDDMQGERLIAISSISGHISTINLLRSRVNLLLGKVEDGQLNIRERQDGQTNIQQMVSHIFGTDRGKGKFHLTINDTEIDNFVVNIEREERRRPSYGVDYGDMSITIESSKIDKLNVNGPAVYASIKRLRVSEKSGFLINDLSGELYVMGGAMGIENLYMLTPNSELNLEYMRLVGNSWREYKNFIGAVEMDALVQNSYISSNDIAYFAPRLLGWDMRFGNINLSVDGTVDQLHAEVKSFVINNATTLKAYLRAEGLPDYRNGRYSAEIDFLLSSSDAISSIISSVSGSQSSQSLAMLGDDISLDGRWAGTIDEFVADLTLRSALGELSAEGKMQGITTKKPTAEATLTTDKFMLGTLINSPKLGALSLEAKIDGTIGLDGGEARYESKIAEIEAMGYRYKNIDIKGEVGHKRVQANLRSHDENLLMGLDARYDWGEKAPDYDFNLDIERANLVALKINQRDTLAILSTKVEGHGKGIELEEIEAEISIREGSYLQQSDTTYFDDIAIKGWREGEQKRVSFGSTFLDMSLRTESQYRDVRDFLLASLDSYLPSLNKNATDDDEHLSDSYTYLSLDVKESTPLFSVVTGGVQLAPGTKLNAMFNPKRKDLSCTLSSDYIERDKMLMMGINFNALNRADSLAIYATAEELYSNRMHIKDCSVLSGIKDDCIHLQTTYQNSDNKVTAAIATIATLSQDQNFNRRLDIEILPSHIARGGDRWDIASEQITISRKRLEIDQFRITSSDQRLMLDGIASTSPSDSLTLSLDGFDISFISDFMPALGYNIDGKTDGSAVLLSGMENPHIEAKVSLDSLRVNTLLAPPLELSARWDSTMEIARLSVIESSSQDTLARAVYAPKSREYRAELEIDSLNIGLIDPPLKGILTDTRGVASAKLLLQGKRREATLSGGVDIRNMRTRVAYTNVTYRLPSARLTLEDNKLICQRAMVSDTLGNNAVMNMEVDLKRLRNINYKVNLRPTNMMVLNTTERDNSLFYGKVFASGAARISGDRRGVKMDIAASTDDNSALFMPLGGKQNLSSAEFITFVSDHEQVDTTSVLARKRLLFERKLQASTTGGNLDINMALDVKPNAEFQLVIDPTVGDIIKGRGEGKINMQIKPKDEIFDIYGDYTISEGSYMFTLRNIISKRFVIESGSTIQWSGDPLDAQLDISAIYKLKTSLQPLLSDESTRTTPVDCIINLSESLTHPEVTFDIALPNADSEQSAAVKNMLNDQETISRQFFYLMLANSFMAESATSSVNALGASTAAATGFELLTNQLSNWLSSSNYNVVIRYRPESDSSSEELDFGFSHGLVGNRLLIELEGNYIVDGSTEEINENSTSNFGGEAYITWLIDRGGALRIKGFTQTIDTYDEDQGLQETGIGIYYKEDFNNFKDLRDRVKARFKRREKEKEEEDNNN